MDRGAWWATVRGSQKLHMTEVTYTHSQKLPGTLRAFLERPDLAYRERERGLP